MVDGHGLPIAINELLFGQAPPGLIQAQRGGLAVVKCLRQPLDFRFERRAAQGRALGVFPIDALKPFQHADQFCVSELEWCRCEKEHALELRAQRLACFEVGGFLGRLIVDEQRGQTHCGILEVVRLVKDKQGRGKPRLLEGQAPDLSHRCRQGLSGRCEPFLDIGGLAERKSAQFLHERLQRGAVYLVQGFFEMVGDGIFRYNLGESRIVAVDSTLPTVIGPIQQITEHPWSATFNTFHAQQPAGKLREVAALLSQRRAPLKSALEDRQLGVSVRERAVQGAMGQKQQMGLLVQLAEELYAGIGLRVPKPLCGLT